MGKILKIGMLGGGRLGKLHGNNIQNNIANANIVTLADPFLNDSMIEWAQSVGIKNTTKDPEDIFTDPEIDAVFICSSTNTHAEFIMRSAAAGKDIFCEKPIDTSIPKIKECMKAVEEAGVKLQVGFVRRFDPNHKAVRDVAQSGQLGRTYVVKVTSRDPANQSMDYIKVSGGIFMDMTIHDFDMVRYLAGSEVEEISAIGTVLTDPGYAELGDVDTAIITMKFANGALGVIDNCRTAPYGYDQRVEVHCEKGCVRDDNVLNNTAEILTGDDVKTAKPTWFFLERYNDAFCAEAQAFVNAVLNGEETAVGIVDGLESVRLAYAADKALKEGRPVKLTEIEA